MGKLEIQDGFAPYFDRRTGIGIENADRKPAKRQPRTDPATGRPIRPKAQGPARRPQLPRVPTKTSS